jgi:hypothetical protein
VVCEGFYEWKAGVSNKLSKQPYYIYAAQNEGVRADNPITWPDEFSETDGWKGFKVLKLAGIYGTYKTEEVTHCLISIIYSIVRWEIINVY